MKRQMVTLLLLVALLVLIPSQISMGKSLEETNAEWLTYTDPRFDFSIQYPADWHVIPRDDSDPTALSGVVTFTSVDPKTLDHSTGQDVHTTGEPQFVIGHYLAEFHSDKSLSTWTDAYEAISNGPEGFEIHNRVSRSVDGRTALSIKGESALLDYQFTNVPNGKIMWFIWMNRGETATDEEQAIYEQAVNSFKLGPKSPASLKSIYGEDFKPQPLEPRIPNTASQVLGSRPHGLAAPLSTIGLPSPGAWQVPIASGKYYRVNCGSSAHVDDAAHDYSRYAADIAMSLGEPVKSAHWSWVDFNGWSNNGYGNLVRASTDFIYSRGYTMYYAHLDSISGSIYAGKELGKGESIGTSGNTGTTGYHLHFHVRSGSDSVDLTGMTGFYPDSDYPDNYADCGYVQR